MPRATEMPGFDPAGTFARVPHLGHMRARLSSLVMGAALASCTSHSDKQLEAVKSVRSVLAEWALAEEQGARRREPSTYLDTMRKQAQDQLKTDAPQLPRAAAALIQPIIDGQPDAAVLKQANSALEPVETQLESA